MKNTVMVKDFRALSFDATQVKQACAPAIPEPLQSLGNKGVTKSKAIMQRTKRIVVTVVGGTVLALGIALIVLPGPAFIVLPAGWRFWRLSLPGPDAGCVPRGRCCFCVLKAILHRIGVRRHEPGAEQNNGGKHESRRIRFELNSPTAELVAIAGTFNG